MYYLYGEKIIVAYLKHEIPFALQHHSLLLRFGQIEKVKSVKNVARLVDFGANQPTPPVTVLTQY